MAEKIIAVVVMYQPPDTLPQLLARLRPQVSAIVVVDNGKNREPADVHYLKNNENGLAQAQNKGIDKARQLGADYVLLMDDDSLPEPEMVSHLLKAQQHLRKEGKQLAVTAPYLLDSGESAAPCYIQAREHSFARVQFTPDTPYLENLYYVAASGSLIPMEVLDEIGPMKEAFSIYFVDTEFCLRARRKGYDIVAVREAKMHHAFGQKTSHRFLGRSMTTTNHPPRARYYMFRNRKRLWWHYYQTAPGYVLFDLLRAQSELLRVILFEYDKIAKCKAMAKGLFA